MHPIDAILEREGKHDYEGRQVKMTYNQFHTALQTYIFPQPHESKFRPYDEFFTRKLVLRFIYLHNKTQEPENQIHLDNPRDSDIEFVCALDEFDAEVERTRQAREVCRNTPADMDDFAAHPQVGPEKVAEVESILSALGAAIRAEEAMHAIKWMLLNEELRDGHNVFRDFIRAYRIPDNNIIQELADKLQEIVEEVGYVSSEDSEDSEDSDATLSQIERGSDHPVVKAIPQGPMSEQWAWYYQEHMPCPCAFLEILSSYAATIPDTPPALFETSLLEALEILIEQAKGKVDIEIEDDESLALDNFDNWGRHGNVSVLIRGYCQKLRQSGTEVDPKVLSIAQAIVEKTNQEIVEDMVEESEKEVDSEEVGKAEQSYSAVEIGKVSESGQVEESKEDEDCQKLEDGQEKKATKKTETEG